MYENIRVLRPNFCIGPQSGTYCHIDTTEDPVVVHIKNELGNLIRTYSFFPNNVLRPEPYDYESSSPESSGYYKPEVIAIKYVGPEDMPSYYDGAIFYTLERRAQVYREYYTEREDEVAPETEQVITMKLSGTAEGVDGALIYIGGVVFENNTSGDGVTEGNIEYRYEDGPDIIGPLIVTQGASSYDFGGGPPTSVYYSDVDNTIRFTFNFEEDVDNVVVGEETTETGLRILNGVSQIVYNEAEERETDERPEYNSNIIRKWKLDTVNNRLMLSQTIIKNSDESFWYDANCFAIQNRILPLGDHSARNSGKIQLPDTSGLKKYDIILLGPSSDTDNIGKVEEVYIHHIDGEEVDIRTYSGYTPPMYDYVEGDSVTAFGDIILFSSSRPYIDDLGIMDGYTTNSGTIYLLDQTNYGETYTTYYNGMFHGIKNSVWNNYFDTLSFVKGTNLIHYSLKDLEVRRSQNIGLYNPIDNDVIELYDIDIQGTTIYKLQDKLIRRDDSGTYYNVGWLDYNFHNDSMEPYTFSATLKTDNVVLFQLGIANITIIVRDQFGVGLLGKNVLFTFEADPAGTTTPLDGMSITDYNGRASLRYDAGSNYHDFTTINARVDGSNMSYGSSYVNTHITVVQKMEHRMEINPIRIMPSLLEDKAMITTKKFLLPPYEKYFYGPCDGRVCITHRITYVYPNSQHSVGTPQDPTGIIYPVKVPVFKGGRPKIGNSPLGGTSSEHSYIAISMLGDLVSNYKQMVIKQATGERRISQNYVSRHHSYGHIATTSVDQYIFINEAKPAMWSEKNNVDTDFWIRLRPFASNLNPNTLSIRLFEKSYRGDVEHGNIVSNGQITMFDSGGGLLGIDFYYIPPEPFYHNSIVNVYIEVYDTSPFPNIITVEYWFKLIQDYKAPYLINQSPSIEEYDVNIDTGISFDIEDVGEGVDINTLEVFVNERSVKYDYQEYEPGNYHINITTDMNFHYGQEVRVTVDARDRSDNRNRLLDGWKFYCHESTGPWFNMYNTEPDMCLEGLSRDQTVSLQVYGVDDTGVDYDSIRIEVGGRYRKINITPIVYRLS